MEVLVSTLPYTVLGVIASLVVLLDNLEALGWGVLAVGDVDCPVQLACGTLPGHAVGLHADVQSIVAASVLHFGKYIRQGMSGCVAPRKCFFGTGRCRRRVSYGRECGREAAGTHREVPLGRWRGYRTGT